MSGQDSFEVVLTERAAQVVLEAFKEQGVDPQNAYLRLGARPGGCSGYKYTMDFNEESQIGPADVRFTSRGVKVVADQSQLETVLGSVEVGYKDGSLMEQGFTFRPLGQRDTCGCGQSFSAVSKSSAQA